MATQILIVDDHPAVREGLAARIANQADMEVCGEAADMAEALKLLDQLQPDVVIVDVQLKNSDGLELVRRIKARNDAIGILVWSAFPDRIYAERALNAGALGYINKEHTTGRIVDAIRQVRDGNIYLCEDMAQHLLSRTVGGTRSLRQSPVESLSDRELEVFRHIGHGQTTGEIAKQLHISPHTIETHRQRIKEKLNVETAAELTQTAVRWVIGKETA
ncbi:MAG: response regulator transcription factor [Patescibacteria group bacterium]|nr:response regulator transcription factor [Patescibacteria group bacterium]